MRIFLSGVSCVGKTAIGAELAKILNLAFFDLDEEIETFFNMSIERLQEKFISMYSYRQEASKALKHILSKKESKNCVIALPPSGLMDNYWRIVKKANGKIVVIIDTPENILKRITFYDRDSNLLDIHLTNKEKQLYLKEIKADMSYFNRTYSRADLTVDIRDLGIKQSAQKIKKELNFNCQG